jgi:hypothetical protein
MVEPSNELPLNTKNGHFLPYPHSIIAGNARLRNRSRNIFLYWSPISCFFRKKGAVVSAAPAKKRKIV